MNYTGNNRIELDDFEIEYEYTVNHEQEVMYYADGTGQPESLEVEIILQGLGGTMNLADFEFKPNDRGQIQKLNMVEYFDQNLDAIIYCGKSLQDWCEEHCLSQLDL
jgi:hypothetical protein